MPLRNYGLLTGLLTSHGPQHGGNPHYLLLIQAGVQEYRVAVNLRSTLAQGDDPAALLYEVIDLTDTKLASIKNAHQFVLSDEGSPTLDYIRDGIVDMAKFRNLEAGLTPNKNPFYQALAKAAQKALTDGDGGFVAVFGTGYPDQDDLPVGPGNNPQRNSTGFTGVDNVHMNQGNYLRVGTHRNRHFEENGVHQDGAVMFFHADGKVLGFFAKFDSQANATDAFGNPSNTGVAVLDDRKEIPDTVRNALLVKAPALQAVAAAVADHHAKAQAPRGKAPKPTKLSKAAAQFATKARRAVTAAADEVPIAGTSGGTAANNYIFGVPGDPDDPNRKIKQDIDPYFKTQYVMNFGKYGVPEPVPGPRNGQYPVMTLESVLGTRAISSITASNQIVFHVDGDTGAPKQAKVKNEVTVAELMLQDFAEGIPSERVPKFYYHVGDVVYYYGEPDYYYDQFYEPYKQYPAPIFAIPGNHDGLTYKPEMVSLEGFVSAFCDDQPRHWSYAASTSRTTMTQPGVYFTLDAPFVSIIGLYTNCGESFGQLDDQQKLFLYKELARLKPLRQNGQIKAVILAVHHSPMSYSATKPASRALRDAIDSACTQAGWAPDAVISGHAHIYQRMTRNVQVGDQQWEIPHVISGSGGYESNPLQEVDKADMQLLDSSDPDYKLHKFFKDFGYVRMTVIAGSGSSTPSTLRFEFLSPSINDGTPPADVCVLNLDTHQLENG